MHTDLPPRSSSRYSTATRSSTRAAGSSRSCGTARTRRAPSTLRASTSTSTTRRCSSRSSTRSVRPSLPAPPLLRPAAALTPLILPAGEAAAKVVAPINALGSAAMLAPRDETLDPFNLSNDREYEVPKEQKRQIIRQTFGALEVVHAYPAQKLQLPFVRRLPLALVGAVVPLPPSSADPPSRRLLALPARSTRPASPRPTRARSTVLRSSSRRTCRSPSQRCARRRRRTRTAARSRRARAPRRCAACRTLRSRTRATLSCGSTRCVVTVERSPL